MLTPCLSAPRRCLLPCSSMREDPQPDKPAAEKLFHGDNFVRSGGEYSAWQSLTVHSINAHEKGLDVHMQVRAAGRATGRAGGGWGFRGRGREGCLRCLNAVLHVHGVWR